MSRDTLYDILFCAGFILIVVGFFSMVTARNNGAIAARLLVAAVGVVAVVVAVQAGDNDRHTYQQRVSAALHDQYGATVTPSSRTLLPITDNARSTQPVTLTVNQTHKSCTVETADGPSIVIAICDGTELPHR